MDKRDDFQFNVKKLIKGIDDNFIVYFTKGEVFITYDNRKNKINKILSFSKTSKIILKYLKLEKILIQKKIIDHEHNSFDIDNNRIKVGFSLIH